MKLESLVIVDHHATVNMFLGLVLTARQITREGGARSRVSLSRRMPKVKLLIGIKS